MARSVRSGGGGLLLFPRLALQVLKENLSPGKGGRNIVSAVNIRLKVIGFQREVIKGNN
jgi:hypothetical protein